MRDKLKIFISHKRHKFLKKTKETLKRILKVVKESLPKYSFKFNSDNNYFLVNLFLIGKKKSQQLNHWYRQINKPTDVLAFPFYYTYKGEINFKERAKKDLGDIFICYPVASKQAREKNFSLEKEFCFLFLHGLLHLLGYDHEQEEEEKIMFELQTEVISKLNYDKIKHSKS